MAKPILLIHWRAPGDITCMTACVRDLAQSHPGEFDVHIAGSCSALWDHNPHVARVWGACPPRGIPSYWLSYSQQLRDGVHEPRHLLAAFHNDLGQQLGVRIPVLLPHGDLHLSDWQRRNRPLIDVYWYLVAGGKTAIATKLWPPPYFQQLVDLLRRQGLRIVQGGASYKGHHHTRLRGVVDMVGNTNLREMLWWIFHAEGVIAPSTFAMHVAAAFEKPCVVIAGSREPWWWGDYINSEKCHFGVDCAPVVVPHIVLHTSGVLPCCHEAGCWRTRVVADVDQLDTESCISPVLCDDGVVAPACMKITTPQLALQR